MPDNPSVPIDWKPAALPRPFNLHGRYVALEPLGATPGHGTDLWQAVDGHDELWTWMAGGPAASPAALLEQLERWREAEKAVLFAIVPADTKKAAGWASYMRIAEAHGVIEIGNVVFSPELQRTRAATEAVYLMARHVFEDLGYRRYEWKCHSENAPSRRAALRFGFTFEGIFRQHMVVKGRNRDTAWFAMLDHEWPARKKAFETWLDPENFDAAGRQRRSLTEIAESVGRLPA